MAQTLLIVMLCLSLFSCHHRPQSAEAALGVTSGGRRAGCFIQPCRAAGKGSLRCTSYYYFKCCLGCKEKKQYIFLPVLCLGDFLFCHPLIPRPREHAGSLPAQTAAGEALLCVPLLLAARWAAHRRRSRMPAGALQGVEIIITLEA